MAAIEGTQCFLTHNWANGNHERVAAVNRALKALGIVTWFDDERMEGQIRKKMAEGIENTQCAVVFITALYRDKVNGDEARDNCQYEFQYAVEQLGPQKMIPVVMEAALRDPKKWRGQLGAALGTTLYVDMCGVEEGTEAFRTKIREIQASDCPFPDQGIQTQLASCPSSCSTSCNSSSTQNFRRSRQAAV